MRTISDEHHDDGIRIENVRVVHATDKALLCEIDGDETWIPKSQISADSEVSEAGDEGTLIITEWIAEQKGLL